jgi:PhzF family phenazine biosynthesis protein
MGITITQVDAFTDTPFAGNPAAVCVTPLPLADEVMQAIAAEMNLSETAFVCPIEEGYSLRWFTPAVEVDLCGHATLASAHVLWSEGHLSLDQIARFYTQSGWLSAKREHPQQANSWIELNFPTQPMQAAQHVMPALVKSLCCYGNIRNVCKNEVNFLVELHSETALRNLQPNFDEIKKLPVQGVIATAAAESDDYDFVSRYFAPAVGIDEDPVTGSAHSSLAPYWQAKLGKADMLAKQISARGGILRVRCETTDGTGRVYISGQAVSVLQGQLLLEK